MNRVPATPVLATVLFFLTGALGLGYELVWIRKATLVVGASQIALATVVTSYFLGMGLGSAAVARWLRGRRRSPLFVYGLFEVGIGAFALAFPLLFRGLEGAYGLLYPLFEAHAAGLFVLRFCLVFGLFLVPTFFMGATLPLLLDGLVARDRSVGALTSFLYGLNILGAVLGVLVTSYFAIPRLGMNGTSLAAGCCNLAIGAVALVSFRGLKPLHPQEAAGATAAAGPFYAALAFTSGLVAIGYQVAWARYFSLFQGATVHFTAVLLAVYLSALSAGSMGLALLLRRGVHPLPVLAVVQPLVPMLAFTCLEYWVFGTYGYQVLDDWEVVPRWHFWSETVDATFIALLIPVAAVILLPVALLGAGLPAIIAAAARGAPSLRSIAGRLVFWNTLGSAAGALAAGYALLPGLGLSGCFAVLAVLSVAVGVASEWRFGRGERAQWRHLLRPGYTLGAAALLYVAVWASDDVTRRTLQHYEGGGVFEQSELIAVEEGPVTTAYVLDGPGSMSLGAGSVRLAVAQRDRLSSQALQGYLPALFYPRAGWPESVLGIALGSGQTFGALLRTPVKRMDVVDISGEVVELALRHFAPFNQPLGSDPRVTFHLDDGRHFVDRASDGSYDVVSLEPPPPTNENVYRLYSLEFYQGVRRVLRDGGVLVQWLPLNLITPDDLRGMLATQARVFPFTFVVQNGSVDMAMLSMKLEAPPRFETAWLKERAELLGREPQMKDTRWARGDRYLAASVEGITSLLITGPDDVAALEAPTLHRDDDQRLSYSSGDRQLWYRYVDDGLERLSFAALPVTPFRRLQQYFADTIPAERLEEDRAHRLAPLGFASPRRLADAIRSYERSADGPGRARKALAVVELFAGGHRVGPALEWIERAIAADPGDGRPEHVAAARRFVAAHAAVHGEQIGGWLAQLPRAQAAAPLAEAMAAELRAFEERDAARRSRYLWE